MHDLFDHHDLEDSVRWVEMQTDKIRVGELYRVVADTRGAFVQPALFEAFGLTVIEAMSSGLPVFATRFGGPLETIEEGVSGFHIDPNHGREATAKMLEFFRSCREDPELWARISEGAMRRTEERYNWPLYASKLLKLSRIYGFWRYISDIEREETRRYLEMFYGLMYRPLARSVERLGRSVERHSVRRRTRGRSPAPTSTLTASPGRGAGPPVGVRTTSVPDPSSPSGVVVVSPVST